MSPQSHTHSLPTTCNHLSRTPRYLTGKKNHLHFRGDRTRFTHHTQRGRASTAARRTRTLRRTGSRTPPAKTPSEHLPLPLGASPARAGPRREPAAPGHAAAPSPLRAEGLLVEDGGKPSHTRSFCLRNSVPRGCAEGLF